MTNPARMAVLIGLLSLGPLLSGCPGMPGAPGSQQKMPPGVLPPPGLDSGGVRTIMGSTITPPDNSFLLVKYTHAEGAAPEAGRWQTCRRITPLESCVLLEGLNYDGRSKDAERDVNQLLPFSGLTGLYWKYEAKPAPPVEEQEEGGPSKPSDSD